MSQYKITPGNYPAPFIPGPEDNLTSMIISHRQTTAVFLTVISLLVSSSVLAEKTETTTANLQVHLTVERSCEVHVSDMDFGTHTRDSGPLNASANTIITCSSGTPFNITSTSDHSYTMKNTATAEKVDYALYSDNAGASELSTTPIPGTGTGSAEVIPIYGKVTARALSQASPGDYSDTVTLTVAY